jgi:L-2,4-diaminobutyrate decarboxylase
MRDLDRDLDLAFSPGSFQSLGHRVVDLLAKHMAAAARREGPVLPPYSPAQSLERWPADFPARGGADPIALLAQVVADSNHLHHPRYVGHQVTSPLPWSALLDFAGAFLNNGSAVFEMGPVATAMERSVIRWFAGRLGFEPLVADGVLTHGGSAGNLTALLAARQKAAACDVWEEGLAPAGALCLITSDQTHYSVRRSAQVMGMGGRSVVSVATDARYRLRPDLLEAALREAKAKDCTVVAVVASAGSTATGAIDPLDAIAELCSEYGVWMHVDGAHGGAAVVSDRLRPSLRGIERADSVVIDAHKMLLAPALATLVVFRDGRRSFETFNQQAAYLFEGQDPTETWHDLAQRTLECTKRMLGLQLYASLKVLGTDFFAAYVERMYDLGRAFAEEIGRRPHWEVATVPEGNIVCFRYAPPGMGDPDAFQTQVRETIVREGSFYLVKTVLRGRTYLRCTLINPRTEGSDLEALLGRVEAEAGVDPGT